MDRSTTVATFFLQQPPPLFLSPLSKVRIFIAGNVRQRQHREKEPENASLLGDSVTLCDKNSVRKHKYEGKKNWLNILPI